MSPNITKITYNPKKAAIEAENPRTGKIHSLADNRRADKHANSVTEDKGRELAEASSIPLVRRAPTVPTVRYAMCCHHD